MDMLTHIFSPFLPVVFTVLRTYILVTTVMGNYRPINGYVDTHIFTFSTCRHCIKDVYTCNHGNGAMLTHIFSPFLPVVFTVLRTYILVTTVMGNYRPINGYVDTHIFTFSTCRIYCIKDVYTCNHGNG